MEKHYIELWKGYLELYTKKYILQPAQNNILILPANILKQISIDVMEKACRLLWKTHFTAYQEYLGKKSLFILGAK